MVKRIKLKPVHYPELGDECEIAIKKNSIEIRVQVDEAGNTFKLPIEKLRGVLKCQ